MIQPRLQRDLQRRSINTDVYVGCVVHFAGVGFCQDLIKSIRMSVAAVRW